jgi:hypothetical protein
MPRGTVEEFLQVASQNKRPQFFEILSHHRYTPGQKNGSLNKTSRLGTRAEPKLTPYKEVLHVLRTNAILGVSYENMVNAQRSREAEAALAELAADLPSFVKLTTEVEPFLAGPLFGGNGERDDQFPKLAARHKITGQRYVVFWPASDTAGKLIPNESRYYDETGRELDFKTELAEYWKLSGKSKVQGTERETHWSVRKFENIVQVKAGKLVWDFEPPVIAALA